MRRATIVDYLNDYLRISEIDDYGPQGLQVEAENDEIERLALAVDAAPAVIEAAADWQADMILVHHGILWRSVEPIAGPLGRRVRLLVRNGINLYAAHLALDAHPQVGNNAVLARMLAVTIDEWWCQPTNAPIGILGSAQEGTTLNEFVGRIEDLLAAEVRVFAYGPAKVKRIAIVSGAGADKVGEAKSLGADTFITGETSHADFWAAADHGVNVIYAGHYATETVGVQALGSHLSDRFGLDTRFLEFPTAM